MGLVRWLLGAASHLEPCFSCGKPVSRHADACPHCGSKELRGYRCAVCRQDRVPRTQLLLVKSPFCSEGRLMHEKCMYSVKAEVDQARYRCPACRTLRTFALEVTLEGEGVRTTHLGGMGPCPHCGDPATLSAPTCTDCGMPTFRAAPPQDQWYRGQHATCRMFSRVR